MKTENFLIIGGLLMLIVGFMITEEAHVDIIKSHQKLIDDCEQELPRDKHCQLVAIPENTNE